MLRMRRRVMRRLVNICLIEITVPSDKPSRRFYQATKFCKSTLRDGCSTFGTLYMLTDPKLRSQVDALWDKFWTGGLANLLSMQEDYAGVVARAVTEPVEVSSPFEGGWGSPRGRWRGCLSPCWRRHSNNKNTPRSRGIWLKTISFRAIPQTHRAKWIFHAKSRA